MSDREVRKVRVGRFDQVRLLTTKNIKYLSAPPESKPNPSGVWSVVSIIGEDELLCAQNSAIIRVPISDVLKIADYSIQNITQQFGKLSYGQEKGNQGNQGNQRNSGQSGSPQEPTK